MEEEKTIETNSEEIKQDNTFVTLKFENGMVIINADCDNQPVFLALLKQMKPILYDAVISSIKDPLKRIMISKSMIDNELVIKPTKVFDFKDLK
jgi:hypothetical protein